MTEAPSVVVERKTGRQSSVTQEVGAAICSDIASGKSLRECCRERSIALSSFFDALHARADLAEQYDRAREARGELLADEIITVADTADAENAYAVKVRVDARKWCAARMCRRVYGDSSSVQVNATVSLDIAERLEQLRGAQSAPVGLIPQQSALEAKAIEAVCVPASVRNLPESDE